jgi:hypothetical protein
VGLKIRRFDLLCQLVTARALKEIVKIGHLFLEVPSGLGAACSAASAAARFVIGNKAPASVFHFGTFGEDISVGNHEIRDFALIDAAKAIGRAEERTRAGHSMRDR